MSDEKANHLVESYEALRKACANEDCPNCPLFGRWGCLCNQEGMEPYRWPKYSDKKEARPW